MTPHRPFSEPCATGNWIRLAAVFGSMITAWAMVTAAFALIIGDAGDIIELFASGVAWSAVFVLMVHWSFSPRTWYLRAIVGGLLMATNLGSLEK
jgi:hypothetical protein